MYIKVEEALTRRAIFSPPTKPMPYSLQWPLAQPHVKTVHVGRRQTRIP
jgi:hypothetical protein